MVIQCCCWARYVQGQRLSGTMLVALGEAFLLHKITHFMKMSQATCVHAGNIVASWFFIAIAVSKQAATRQPQDLKHAALRPAVPEEAGALSAICRPLPRVLLGLCG